jgi:hypothetical protein
MKLSKEIDWQNIQGKLVTFRNGERLIASRVVLEKGQQYAYGYLIFFESVSRYRNFTRDGKLSLHKSTEHDIIQIGE